MRQPHGCRPVRAALLSRIEALPAPPRAVLDLGAGTGLAALAMKRRFRRARVTAADIAAPMLQVARRRSRFWGRIHCIEADARALPFEDGAFDLVFSNLMLQWLLPPDRALSEILELVRHGTCVRALRSARASSRGADFEDGDDGV